MISVSANTAGDPRILIVGGGFGGLAAARALRKSQARVLLIDKTNHHVFQPLLYQVATSILSPEHIGAPIRHVLRGQANTTVIQGTVTGSMLQKRCASWTGFRSLCHTTTSSWRLGFSTATSVTTSTQRMPRA